MRTVITLTILFFTLQACRKEKNKEECVISSIVGFASPGVYGGNDSSITEIQYKDNRVIRSLESIDPGQVFARTVDRIYEYAGDKLIKIRVNNNGFEYYYSITYDGSDNVHAVDYSWSHRRSYFYSGGKLSKISYRHGTYNLGLGEHDIEFTYSGNNVVKVTEAWLGSGDTTIWHLSYNSMPNTHFKHMFLPNYFSFSDSYTLAYTLSENLVSKVESSVGGTSIFNYTFSTGGRVSSITETFTSSVNNFSKKATYVYRCQ